MNMSLAQARVVDPVLTEHIRGYLHPERVGNILFPPVPVDVSAGKVVEFGRESFILYNARRAPGASTKRIEFGYLGKPYALVQDSLESKIPREFAREAGLVPGIDLGFRASNIVMQSLTLALEVEQAGIAMDINSYPADHKTILSGSSQWTDPSAVPFANIETARQVIRQSCGFYPNVAVAGPRAYRALKNHPSVIARFRNSDVTTAAMLAEMFELEKLVEGSAVVADAAGATFSDVWGTHMVLAYAPQTSIGLEEPSFGYTYTMKANPYVEAPYWDGNQKSWIYGVTYERAPVLTGMGAGYMIQNAGN